MELLKYFKHHLCDAKVSHFPYICIAEGSHWPQPITCSAIVLLRVHIDPNQLLRVHTDPNMQCWYVDECLKRPVPCLYCEQPQLFVQREAKWYHLIMCSSCVVHVYVLCSPKLHIVQDCTLCRNNYTPNIVYICLCKLTLTNGQEFLTSYGCINSRNSSVTVTTCKEPTEGEQCFTLYMYTSVWR